MTWASYLSILRRRWWIVAVILSVDVVGSLYLYRKAHNQAGSQACLTLYVADVSAPSTISAPQTTLETAGQLLAGETAANFFADDILDVAQSRSVGNYIKRRIARAGGSTYDGSVAGSRRDRTVDLCVTAPDARVAQQGAIALASAMTRDRSRFIGHAMAKRTFVNVISPPLVSAAPTSNALRSLLLRLALGLLAALGAAFLWDALDSRPAARTEDRPAQ